METTETSSPKVSESPPLHEDEHQNVRGPGKDTLWTVRMELAIQQMRRDTGEIFRSLKSPDRSTRRMSFLFFVSLAGALLAASILTVRYWKERRLRLSRPTAAQIEARHLSEFLEKQAEEAKRKFNMYTLGVFTIELKLTPGQAQLPGSLSMAEAEIVLECDSKPTRDFVEEHSDQARNEITSVLVPIDRDELISREGKKRLKKEMQDKLNQWLPHGSVRDIYFTKLMLI